MYRILNYDANTNTVKLVATYISTIASALEIVAQEEKNFPNGWVYIEDYNGRRIYV